MLSFTNFLHWSLLHCGLTLCLYSISYVCVFTLCLLLFLCSVSLRKDFMESGIEDLGQNIVLSFQVEP